MGRVRRYLKIDEARLGGDQGAEGESPRSVEKAEEIQSVWSAVKAIGE
jgi:hypothetical protein